MSGVLIKTFVTFFAIYGITELIRKTLVLVLKKPEEKKDIFIFIHVRNQEDSVEYIVRKTIFNYLEKYGGRLIPFIVVVDRGSEDRTSEICQRLCNDYEFLYYTTEEEYIKFRKEIV